jgi:hypothetical protein
VKSLRSNTLSIEPLQPVARTANASVDSSNPDALSLVPNLLATGPV